MTVYYLSATGALILLASIIMLVYKFANKKLNIVFKVVSLVMAALYIIRYCTGRDNLESIINLSVSNGFTSSGQIVFGVLQVWSMFACELMLFMYPFFRKNVKYLDIFVGCGTLVCLVNFAGLSNHILSVDGLQAVSETVTARGVMIAVETGLSLAYSALILTKWIMSLVQNKKAAMFVNADESAQAEKASAATAIVAEQSAGDAPSTYKTAHMQVTALAAERERLLQKKWGWIWPALGLMGIILCTMPYYTLQLMLNPYDYAAKVIDLNYYHRIYIYFAFVLPVALYILLKDKSYETKRFILLYYSLAALNSFVLGFKFIDFQGNGWVTSLPLHLCNTALYVTPLCLTFKAKKVFYFTYFINVLGAFFAITMPNYSLENLGGSMIMSDTVSFFLSHYQAFFMPLLVVGLGIFRRPRFKEFKYSLVGFAVYFLLMLICNGWFTNYNPNVDYFFINSNFVSDKLGSWAENLRISIWEFDIGSLHFKYYPIYQSLYFLVYVGLSFGMWFLYELGYNAVQGWHDIAERKKKIKLDSLALAIALNGRNIEEPMDMENINKLVLNNFTKRYGTSDVYAVKDANLTVCGGQIFGFLGPNGAGKSTIIKSIVGIQTITAGSISVCGYDVKTQSVQAKKQIGFVPDHYALYEKLTAREYINYIADLYGVSLEDRQERLNNFIELFEFESAIDNQIKTYSHGMKQKVTIMSALIHNPKVWILDEPLTGLDPNSIFQVKECMKRHAEAGNIVFFSSHIIDVVERICDRIAIIRKGQIQCVKDVAEIEKECSLEELYMSVINGSEVKPIEVDAKDKVTKNKEDNGKKSVFSKLKEKFAKKNIKDERTQQTEQNITVDAEENEEKDNK